MPSKAAAGAAGKRAQSKPKARVRPKVDPPEEHNEDPTSLRETDVPGVYLNSLNMRVNENGVALTFLQVKEADEARFERVIGSRVDTPAKLLKAVALDPTMNLAVRIDSAKSAAPYFDRKMPVALDGGIDPNSGAVVPLFDTTKLGGLSTAELKALKGLIAKGAGSA